MSATAPYLRKPVLGGYQPDARGRCLACGRRRLCSAACRLVARRLRAGRSKLRRAAPVNPVRGSPYALTDVMQNLVALGRATFGHEWRRPVARLVGVSTRTISRWIQGQGRPTDDDLRRLIIMARRHVQAVEVAYEMAVKLTNVRLEQARTGTKPRCNM
jgi:Helix-turn-helix